jgi:alpha-amylase
MDRVNFPIVFHFHQPVDNFDSVIEEVYTKAYFPLLERIKKSKVKFTLHFTGSMLEWFRRVHPEFLDDVRVLCQSGRVEMLGGGYYEPILPIIPDDDKIEQLKMLTETLQTEFGVTPRGMWLAERVWEPHLPKYIKQAGLQYIIVDDNHLRSLGFREEDTFYFYTTEEAGEMIFVFPINEPARYIAPWMPVVKLREYLEGVRDEKGDRIVLYIADAEKMGAWATTNQLCYVQGHDDDGGVPFVEAFFDLIGNTEWIESLTLSDCINRFKARGLIYIPNASYDKMEEWVLPTESRRKLEIIRERLKNDEIPGAKDLELERFIKGGFWRYFLVKYPEANNMHKKMYRVHDRIVAYEQAYGDTDFTKEARKELYMSEANDCYWHGQFGGVYLNFFRHSVYRHALLAETMIADLYRTACAPATPLAETTSFLKDGQDQVLLETSRINAYINPADGGTMFELDFKDAAYNLMNTLARWKEAYHFGGNDQDLIFDAARKVALRDMIVRRGIDVNDYRKGEYIETADFSKRAYDVLGVDADGTKVQVNLAASTGDGTASCSIRKSISLEEDSPDIEITYLISGVSEEFFEDHTLIVEFPVYFNGDTDGFQLLDGQPARNPLDGVETSGDRFTLRDETNRLNVAFSFSSPVTAWMYKHETFSRMNTDDYQAKYQAIMVVLLFEQADFSFRVSLSQDS